VKGNPTQGPEAPTPEQLPEGNYTYGENGKRFEVIHRDGKVRIITNADDAADDFVEHEQAAMKSVRPLGVAPKAKAVPIPRAKDQYIVGSPLYREAGRQSLEAFLNNPEIPEWRKTRIRAMVRTDI
jgi:hypothetical protein